ncbi:hypothetical protein AB0H82_22365 [Streptomyces sp. NPDC050732]|uniref:hypothetical protein n=1 Tax=Streptomyces sp. NPDC050732 TaxID=3154632 RepID=UPI00342E9FB5
MGGLVAVVLQLVGIELVEAGEAADEARRIIELSGELSSDRTAARTRVVLERLQPYAAVPAVCSVLAEHGHLPLT